jgi:hypothetical protein
MSKIRPPDENQTQNEGEIGGDKVRQYGEEFASIRERIFANAPKNQQLGISGISYQ